MALVLSNLMKKDLQEMRVRRSVPVVLVILLPFSRCVCACVCVCVCVCEGGRGIGAE